MKPRDLLKSGRLQYATLWALAAICVGGALAGVSLLGSEPAVLATLATVFAASASAYGRRDRCRTA